MLVTKGSSTILSESSDGLSVHSARARLAHRVRVALRRSGHSELRNAEIKADEDAVTISGHVPSFYLKQLAQELAKVAAPTHRIQNDLDVRNPSYAR